MSDTDNVSDTDKKLGAAPYVIGGLSFIPLIGILFGIAAIVWGLVTKRKGGKTLALVGAGGIAFTFVIYGGLFYFGAIQRGGVYDDLRGKLAQHQLNQLVQSIEFYKVTHGSYPASLEQLQEALGKNSPVFVHDPTDIKLGTGPRYFHYERVGTDQYYLRSVGQDGQPFTPDDIVPEVNVDVAAKLGLLIDPPPRR